VKVAEDIDIILKNFCTIPRLNAQRKLSGSDPDDE